jgi:hypothetical protein
LRLRQTGDPPTAQAQGRDARAGSLARGVGAGVAGPGGTAAAQLPHREGFGKVWTRLVDPTIHRPYRVTCWRILHCRLGCNGFLYHVSRLGSPLCPHPACAAAGCVETLSHVFLDCPEVRPTVDWLLDTWFRLTGLVAPRTARFLLADDPDGGWPGCGQDPWVLQQWTRLRVAVLGAVWRARCRPSVGGSSLARGSASEAVGSLVAAIERDWLRTRADVRFLDASSFCQTWWRGFDGRLSIEAFEQRWARSPAVFCVLVGETPAQPGDPDERELQMRLSLSSPVPLPP